VAVTLGRLFALDRLGSWEVPAWNVPAAGTRTAAPGPSSARSAPPLFPSVRIRWLEPLAIQPRSTPETYTPKHLADRIPDEAPG